MLVMYGIISEYLRYLHQICKLYHTTSRVSLLLHKSEAKPGMSVNSKDIIATNVYLGYNCICMAYYPKDSINQRFFCGQQAMASGYVHLSKLPLSLTIYSFDFFLR